MIEQLKTVASKADGTTFSYGVFRLYDFSNDIYVYDDSKFTTISKTDALEFAKLLETKINLLVQ